jgi:glucose/arabinose dehydrogenase
MRRSALALALAMAMTLVLAACGGGSKKAAPTTTTTAAPTTTTTAAPAITTTTAPSRPATGMQAVPVAKLDKPTALATRAGDPALYVAEKTGRVRKLVSGAVAGGPVVDVSGDLSLASEQGLLGLAFGPDGKFAYVYWTSANGDIHVGAHDMGNGNPAAVTPVLTVPHPNENNHNGGQLAFGPDGFLYIGVGDGGNEHDPNNVGQNQGTLLAKILRIQPTPGGPKPYAIPPGNPFVGKAGALPETWAYGLRNPWRFSFDRQTGDLWIADVGQDMWEEIDVQPAASKGGENYEWSLREATHPQKGARPAGGVEPIYEYSHAGGNCSITGGYVYRGTKAGGFQGAYLFADYCAGNIQVLRRSASGAVQVTPLNVHVNQPSSFGEDAAGELYVLSLTGDLLRLDPTF